MMIPPPIPLRRAWMVVNAGSGSTDATVIEALSGQLGEMGITVAGTTDFPEQVPPDAATLGAAGADTLLICGGDGTINAAWSAVDDWPGQCLVLPGGTMNGLAKALHGDATREAILGRLGGAHLVHPPLASIGERHALVGIILGPAASWVHAREGVRKGRFVRAWRAARLAWARSFGRSVRVGDSAGRHRAVIVIPVAEALQVATFSVDGIADVMRLGWQWLTGDWRTAAGVSCADVAAVTIHGRRTVRTLFDGEPAMLPSPVCVRHGRTRLPFLSTLGA